MADDAGFGGGFDLGTTPMGAPTSLAPPNPGPGAVPQQSEGGGFGGFMRGLGFGSRYTPPDPATSSLDQAADLLQQRTQRANKIATDPIAQFFAPEQVQKAREFVPKAAEELQKIEKQKADIRAGRKQADMLGLDPGETSDQATKEDRVTAAQQRALKGDLKAFQGLQAVSPKDAEAIQDQVHNAVAKNLTAAQSGFDLLANARNQGEYTAALRKLRNSGDIAGLESLGLKVPERHDMFEAAKGREAEALRNARIGVDTIRQKLEDRNTYQPMEEKEAKTHNGYLTTAYGDQITNGVWSRNKAAGTRGLVVNGAANPKDLGKGFTFATPEQRKAIGEEFKEAVPKEDMEKFRAGNRTYNLATRDSKGNFIPPEGVKNAKGETSFINTNPNVQQGIAESLASMLRGGTGGANVGLLKIELAKRGWAQGTIDSFVSNYAGALNTMFRDANAEGKPYLSQRTQKQIRDVMDVLHEANDSMISDRTVQIAKRAGALGLDAAAFGFGEKESAGVVSKALEEGRQAQIDRMTPHHQAIGGGDGVFQVGAQVPGAGAVRPPAGTTPTTQLQGGPLATPVQQENNPTAPAPGTPPRPSAPLSSGGQSPSGSAGPGGGTPPNTPVAPPTGGATPGRTGLPPNMPLDSPPALEAAANRTIQIESGFKPGQKTPGGTYVGLGQWSKAEMARHGITDPDDIGQTRAALKADMQTRAAKLQKDGLPATAANVYLMHQQGEAGLEAHLRNPDGVAWENVRFGYKSDTMAKRAIFGNMTPDMKRELGVRNISDIDNVTSGDFTRLWEARYSGTDRVAADTRLERTAPRHGEETETARERIQRRAEYYRENPGTPGRDAAEFAVEHAPAIGSTVGAIGGGAAGGVPGAVAGGGIGGAAGQSLKDYLLGNAQNPTEIAKQGALGAVLGVAPEGRPIVGALTRTLGAGGVEGGARALEPGADAGDIAEAAGRGTAAAAAGEGFGRALGMGLHKLYSLFTPEARTAVRAAAANLHAANETLKTEQPKLPGAAGAADTANPKYEAAQAAKEAAELKLKEMMPNAKPDEVAYAHKVTSENVPRQEAEIERPGAAERERIGAGYQQLERDVGRGRDFRNPDRVLKDAGLRPDGKPALEDGPIAAVQKKQVSAAHAELAERTEMAVTAPAKNWQEKWVQLKDVRSALLDAERDALTSTAPGKTRIADDMRTLANTVRAQQVKAAEHAFGSVEGPKIIDRLKVLDTRYRRLMDATNGGDMTAAARLTGEKGRAADRAFRAFAQDDRVALAAWDALRRRGPDVEKDIRTLVGAERIPVLGHVISAVKLAAGYNQWRAQRAAGSPARFEEFVPELKEAVARRGRTFRDVGGTIGARAGVDAIQQ